MAVYVSGLVKRVSNRVTCMMMAMLMVASCGIEGGRSEQLIRKLTPRPMRTQIFSNTPTPYNQERFEQVDVEKVKRELRNGIRGYGEPVRMRANKYRENYMNTEDSYGKGFEDGCKTYLGIIGAGTYRMVGHRYDAERMLDDPWYLRGFQDASTFCTFRMDWEVH